MLTTPQSGCIQAESEVANEQGVWAKPWRDWIASQRPAAHLCEGVGET